MIAWDMAGAVMNRAGLELPQTHYDYVVLGGGLLGLACAFYLKKSQPDASLLIVEQDGIPSETGATHVSPAVMTRFFEDADLCRRAEWNLGVLENLSEETGVTRPHDLPFRRSGVLQFLTESGDGATEAERVLEGFSKPQQKAIAKLINLEQFPFARLDKRAGYGSAEAVALHYGHGAVKRGADLLLNARALPLSEKEIGLERLEFDRFMRRVVVRKETLRADNVIVALGANSATFVEEALGSLLAFKRIYRQYPRIEADKRLPIQGGRVQLPVIQAHGFTLRAQGEGLLVIPPELSPDPDGYTPTGANLMGVRVGVRREILEVLMDRAEQLPAFAWDSLNLGKTVAKVRGAWEVVTKNGFPTWQQVEGSTWYALVGGKHGFSLGLSTVYDLAAHLSDERARPWN